jgi:hypothetical protein
MIAELCCEQRCEMSGETGRELRKVGEGLTRRSPSAHAGCSHFLPLTGSAVGECFVRRPWMEGPNLPVPLGEQFAHRITFRKEGGPRSLLP